VFSARSHLGADEHNAAKTRRRRRFELQQAEEYLLANLPLIGAIRQRIFSYQPFAQNIDLERRAFWARASKPHG
jgi:hypothetical protein